MTQMCILLSLTCSRAALNVVQDIQPTSRTPLSKITFPLQTFHDTPMCLCLFVLCHPAAPDGNETVVQSDETENGTMFKKKKKAANARCRFS